MYRILKEDDGAHSKLIKLAMVSLFFAAMFSTGFPVEATKADGNTIYIRPDGSVDPPMWRMHIRRVGETYTLLADVTESIVIERDNTVVDGAGHMVQGVGDVGLDLSRRNNVTVRNFRVVGFLIGVSLNSSDNCFIMFNTVRNNTYGIRVVNSSDCDFCLNNVTDNWYGIFLNSRPSASRDFTLLENDVSSNDVGVWLWNSSGNTVYHNNFFDNSIQFSLHNSYNNRWDNGFEGNYWDDYHGNDADKDAIGDAPYRVDENNTDKCPLMARFRQLSIQIKNEFYKIGTVCNCTILSEKSELSFKLSDVEGVAFCRLCVPNALVEPPYSVVVGPPYAEYTPLDHRIVEANGTHTWIYFRYPRSGEATITVVKAVEALPFWFEWWFWGICALVVATAVLFGKYTQQRRTIETYKRQLEIFPEVSYLDRAMMLFRADVDRRRRKIEEFQKKYGVRIRRVEDSFEDALERLGIERKREE